MPSTRPMHTKALQCRGAEMATGLLLPVPEPRQVLSWLLLRLLQCHQRRELHRGESRQRARIRKLLRRRPLPLLQREPCLRVERMKLLLLRQQRL